MQQNVLETEESSFTLNITTAPLKRGPGRPRIKTAGPINQSLRGTSRGRKPYGGGHALVVPLGHNCRGPVSSNSPMNSPGQSNLSWDNVQTPPPASNTYTPISIESGD